MNTQQSTTVRIVTAASLFDGHDAAINIMRRILQSKGAEVIHLGHDRSAHEIVECAIEEDAHGIAITSYQGGHMEFFKYIKDLLDKSGCGHIKIFGGGGGTILPKEAEQLHQYGITRIYSPDDGRTMGLEGMVADVIAKCIPGNDNEDKTRFWKAPAQWTAPLPLGEINDIRKIARAITFAEQNLNFSTILSSITKTENKAVAPVIGITGTGGAGKSSVTDEIVRRYLSSFPGKTIAVISVDPSKKKTGGALLGDRIRMNAISGPRVYMRSLATREDNTAISKVANQAIAICKTAGYDCIILETAGTGQSDMSIVDYCDVSVYIMTPEYGAASQLEKINMLDYADIIAINKFDKAGAEDALNDVRKQYKRNHQLFGASNKALPVIGICANTFNDTRVNHFFALLIEKIKEKTGISWNNAATGFSENKRGRQDAIVIPPRRVRYLSEISDSIREYNRWANEQSIIASQLYQVTGAMQLLKTEKENTVE
ncbi:MAG TPA: cobalamin-dependent protein [Agriterribacter sp.]|nr:cobalamin-dependent protein [Agriterribacter sp.]